jgi:branched-chain amino acid transport system substrate-binding protein
MLMRAAETAARRTGAIERRIVLRKAIASCLIAGATVAIGACGGGGGGGPSGKNLTIYSSLPLTGSSTAQTKPMVDGMKLALDQAHSKAGQFNIKYVSLNDATAQAGAWDPGQCASDARKAVSDSSTIIYLGEFNSGCSEVSIPILNRAGIPQISPANTYVGLTFAYPGVTLAGEPEKYYPGGTRTYLRIVPNDLIQGAADDEAMKQQGCTKVAVANDKEAYGAGLAELVVHQAKLYGLDITSNEGINPKAPNFRSYASTVKSEGADCFFFAGIVSNGAVELTKDINNALPTAKIFGADGVCTSSYTNAKEGGVPASVDPKLYCTVATQDLHAYPGGEKFLAAYKKKYGVSNPDPYAIYGYEDMSLALNTIASLGPKGNDRSAVLNALFNTKNRKSVLGTYSFDKDGDTTLKSYGFYNVGSDGNPAFIKTLTPKTLPPPKS